MQEIGEDLRAAAGQLRGGVSDKLSSLSGAMLFKAIFLALLGICAIVWPATSISVLLLTVAVLLILDGIVGLFGVFRANERGVLLSQSLLSIAVGAVLLFWPGASIRTLFLLVGVWALLHGGMLLWALRDTPKDEAYRSTQKTVGIILAVIGAVLLFWPSAGIVGLSWVLGIAALVIAGVLFWLSQRMKQLNRRVAGESA